MATIKEIAKLANVSMATVSRVLNKDEQIVVSEAVRNHIFTIAHELGYVPLKQRRIPLSEGITIGLADWHIIRQNRTNQKLNDLTNMAKRFCTVPVNFVQVTYQEDVLVQGIIAIGHFLEDEVKFLNRQSCYIMFVDSDQDDYLFDRIFIDHMVGMKEMVSYYKEQKKYRSIGYIGGIYESKNVVIGKTRSCAFMELLKQNGMYDESCYLSGDMTKDSGYELAMKVRNQGHLPDAILIGNDEIAEGVLQAFAKMEEKQIAHTELILYRDIETSCVFHETGASIQIYTDFMWEYAIKLLLERMSGKRKETLTLTFPSKFLLCR